MQIFSTEEFVTVLAKMVENRKTTSNINANGDIHWKSLLYGDLLSLKYEKLLRESILYQR